MNIQNIEVDVQVYGENFTVIVNTTNSSSIPPTFINSFERSRSTLPHQRASTKWREKNLGPPGPSRPKSKAYSSLIATFFEGKIRNKRPAVRGTINCSKRISSRYGNWTRFKYAEPNVIS